MPRELDVSRGGNVGNAPFILRGSEYAVTQRVIEQLLG